MKKRMLFLIIIISIVSSVIVVKDLGKEKIETISAFFADNDDNFYYIENGYTFYKIDKNGNVLFDGQIESQVSDYYDILADDDKNIYIPYVSTTQDIDGKRTFSQYISVYNSNGDYVKNIFEASGQNLKEDFRIFKIQKVRNKMVVFSRKTGEIQCQFYDFKTGEITLYKNYEFQKRPRFSDIVMTVDGSIYYSDSSYNLYCLDNPQTMEYNKKVNTAEIEASLVDKLSTDKEGNIYLNDLYGGRFIKYDGLLNETEVIYNKNDIVVDDITYFDLSGVRTDGENIYAISNAGRVPDAFLFIKDVGAPNYTKAEELNFSFGEDLKGYLIVFGIIFCALMLIYLYCYFIKNTRSILIRQVMVTVVLIIGAAVAVSMITANSYSNSMLNNLKMQLYNLGNNIKSDLDIQGLKDIELPLREDSPEYSEINSNVNIDFGRFYEMYPKAVKFDFYYNIMVSRNNTDYVLCSAKSSQSNYTCGKINEYLYENAKIVERKVNGNGDIAFEIAKGAKYTDICCIQDIKDKNGETIGKIETGLDLNEFQQEVFISTMQQVLLIFFVMSCILVIFMILLKKILKGLKELKRGAVAISETEWDTVVDIDTKDELEDIGNSFNRMTNKIKDYFNSIERLNKAYRKFVPSELFELLEKESILDVELGDEAIKDISVMVVQTKNFYVVKNDMSTEESFAFLNNLFGRVSGIIKKSGGIIEEYRGGGLSALYQNDIDRCIESGLSVFEKINREETDIIIYIQSGEILVGIVGDDERMEVTAVSEVLNSSYYIERIAEANDLNMIITGAAYEKISDKDKFNLRFIGRIKHTEAENGYVELYDIIDAYSYAEKTNKLLTSELFEMGVNYYINGDLRNARNKFIDVLKIDKDDKLAQSYVFMCDRHKNNVSEDWNGFFEIL